MIARQREYDPILPHRQEVRLATDDELLADRARCRWLLKLAAAGEGTADGAQMVRWKLEAVEGELDWRDRRDLHFETWERTIPRAFLDDLKARLPLHEVIERDGVVLKKSGDGYRGACPLHGGTNPTAFAVHDEHGFYCFSCHVGGGDIFAWADKRWGQDFTTNVHVFAALAGLSLPDPQRPSNRRGVRLVAKGGRRAS